MSDSRARARGASGAFAAPPAGTEAGSADAVVVPLLLHAATVDKIAMTRLGAQRLTPAL
jgi:hypothetical protein